MSVPHEFQTHSGEFDSRLLEQLACPVCLGTLRLVSSVGQIVCVECRRAYPLIDGIPVLIPERTIDTKNSE
jgi:uncharacterized protein YbaR (Trm112 family)